MENSNTLIMKTFIGDELVELIGEYKLLKIYIDSKYCNHIYLIQDNRLLCEIDLPNNYLNSKIKILESMYEQITFLLESPIKYEEDDFEDLVLTKLEIILDETQRLLAEKELEGEALTKEKNLVSELEILRSCYEILFDYIVDSNHTNDLKIDLSREVLLKTKNKLDGIVYIGESHEL